MFVLDIPMPAVSVNALAVQNGCIIVAIQQGTVARATAYHVARDQTVTPIISSDTKGKDNSATVVLFEDGELWLIVGEADLIDGSPGATSKIRVYTTQTDLRPLAGGTTDAVAHSRIDTVVRRQKALRQKLAEASATMQS